MLLINCKVHLKLKGTKYCVLSSNSNDNTNANHNNIIFTFNGTLLYVRFVTLTVKDTTGCLFGYVYMKNYFRLMTVNLGRQKELNTHSKAIQ